MITYFKMKRNEWKVRSQFYGAIAALIDNRKDIISFSQRLYQELKDVPADELRDELIRSLAGLIHEENQKN